MNNHIQKIKDKIFKKTEFISLLDLDDHVTNGLDERFGEKPTFLKIY